VTRRPKPFNPLEKEHIAESVARVLLNQPVESLPPEPFIGAGIYAIYYSGDFVGYEALRTANADDVWALPIYVGRAQPEGARKGLVGVDAGPTSKLYDRLRQHARSIDAAANLDIADFRVRFLVVDDIWIPLAERLLISWFSPVWNVVVDGFGNHDPGAGRHKGARPLWDTLHPGREWADRLEQSTVSTAEIEANVREHLAQGWSPHEAGDDVAIVDLMAAEE